jgi:hypothetical protein
MGDPLDQKYSHLNLFPEWKDLPVIKPRTTVNNKNEFNVEIDRRLDHNGAPLTADMSLFPKPLLKEAEETEFSQLRQQIDDLKKQLQVEKQKLEEAKQDELREKRQPKRRSRSRSTSGTQDRDHRRIGGRDHRDRRDRTPEKRGDTSRREKDSSRHDGGRRRSDDHSD